MSATAGTAQSSADRQTAAAILARLDRLPATRHVWLMVTLLSLGGMFEFYDLFMTGYVIPGLVKAGLLTGVSRRHVLGSGAVRRLHVLRPVHRHLRVRLRRRQIRTAGHLHVVDAGLLRRHAGHGVPDHRLRRLPLAHDRRHRHRRRTGHDRHLRRGTGAQAHARPSVRVQPMRAVLRRAGRRVPLLYAGAADAAGLGRLALGGRRSARSAPWSSGSCAAPSRKARAGCSPMAG